MQCCCYAYSKLVMPCHIITELVNKGCLFTKYNEAWNKTCRLGKSFKFLKQGETDSCIIRRLTREMSLFFEQGCILNIYCVWLDLDTYLSLFHRGKGWFVSLRCVVSWRRSTRRFCPSTHPHWVKKSWIRRESMPWSRWLRNSLR